MTFQIAESSSWPPHGVSVLVGRHGSGKSRLLTETERRIRAPLATFVSAGRVSRVAEGDDPWIETQLYRMFPYLVGVAPNVLTWIDDIRRGRVPGIDAVSPSVASARAWLDALAGAPGGSLVMLDDVSGIHPAAARAIVATARDRSEEHDLDVVIATHLPAVLDAFRDVPDLVYVMRNGRPIRLTDIHDPKWLANFSLGDLYDREVF